MLTKQEIRQLDITALQTEIASAQKELFKILFSVKNGQSKESHMITRWKRYIAQLQTIKNEISKETPAIVEMKPEKTEKEEKKSIVKKTSTAKKRTTARKTTKKTT